MRESGNTWLFLKQISEFFVFSLRTSSSTPSLSSWRLFPRPCLSWIPFYFCFSLWISTFICYFFLLLLLNALSGSFFRSPCSFLCGCHRSVPLGPFDLPESCSVVQMIWREIPAVAFPPLTFFHGISFTSNERVQSDCNLCCVINRPLNLSLSLSFIQWRTT